MNALQPIPRPQQIEDTEAYDDLCELVAHKVMSPEEFSRRVKELKNERPTDRH
jgi:hypothetical protein